MPKKPAPDDNELTFFGGALALIGLALKLAAVALTVLVPLAAAWTASSLAAHNGGSMRAAAASGLLFFPVLPVAWELFASWRRARAPSAANARPRFLTLPDRLVLRTLVLSGLFLGALVAKGPQPAFAALNARGDWMLDGRHTPGAETARRGLFSTASGLRWLYKLTDDNPFNGRGRPRPGGTTVNTQPVPVGASAQPVPSAAPSAGPGAVVAASARDPHAWPWAEQLHPVVTSIPAEVETSPRSVGVYIAERVSDPWERAKAVHDYVADRIAYDVPSYRAGVYPSQAAADVLQRRSSVCDGYSRLFDAIGAAAGLETVRVVGKARGVESEGMGGGHAWNAVKLGGRWYLVDTTWDAGNVDDRGFHKSYGTAYFLTPPEAFFPTHWPDEPHWQLFGSPKTEGDYLRSPQLRPAFFAAGLRLRSPDRGESDARGSVSVTIENPRRARLQLEVAPEGGAQTICEGSTEGDVFTATCPLAGPGAHQVLLFADRSYGGALRVFNR